MPENPSNRYGSMGGTGHGDDAADEVEPIRHRMTVRCSPERAFELFTELMGTWWPMDSYSRKVSEFSDQDVEVERLEFQPRLGGSVLEHLSDGRILPWARIIGWHPPTNLVLAWRPHSSPEPPTDVEMRFTALGSGTLVELEHRGWERLSKEFREGLYEIYVRGWITTLGLFAAAADRAIEQGSTEGTAPRPR